MALANRYPSVSNFAGFVDIGFTHRMMILRHTATKKPMGVAIYKTAEDVRTVLPSEEELRRVMDEKD